MTAWGGVRAGWIAEFDSPAALLAAARGLREQGYDALEVHSPYELPEADDVLERPRPRALPLAVLCGGLVGALSGYGIQWYSSVAYPAAVTGARPIHAPPAFVPVTFELGVLLAAFAGFFGLFTVWPLLRLWQPVFEAPGFGSSSNDGFWLGVDARDPRFDPQRTRDSLAAFGPRRIERVGEPT